MKKYLCECCYRVQSEERHDLCEGCRRDWKSLREVYRRLRLRFPKMTESSIGMPEALAWLLYKATGNEEDKVLALQIKEWTA